MTHFLQRTFNIVLGGRDNIHMEPGSEVLYLGAALGTAVTHVAGNYNQQLFYDA